MGERIFGHVSGYPEGSWFASRLDLSKAGVHRPHRAGISGRGREGADSVVLAGGYEDAHDCGEEILYTGHGGRDPVSGQQIGHQVLTRGNIALATNRVLGLPVRLIRGAQCCSPHAPASGYRYDGLFLVESYWRERGPSGFILWKFRLLKLPSVPMALHPIKDSYMSTRFTGSTSPLGHSLPQTETGRQLKELYHYRCQICGVRLLTPVGPYAEAAPIRPLTAPHHGPDAAENMLCLCPNHHVLLTLGGIAIADDFTLLGQEGRLTIDFRHHLKREHVRYHRQHCWLDPDRE